MNKEAMEMWIMLANKHNCSNCKHGGWGQKCHDCVFDHSEEWCEEYGVTEVHWEWDGRS